ncbi:MAG: NAD(P)-binding protein [Thermoflexales bacterium]
MPSAVVIGADVGGVAVAARLAQRGWSVQVFEKNNAPAGALARRWVHL